MKNDTGRAWVPSNSPPETMRFKRAPRPTTLTGSERQPIASTSLASIAPAWRA